MIQLKRCQKCTEEKPINDFPKNKQYRDGYSSWCSKCHNSYCAQDRHRIRCRENKRAWRLDPEFKKHEAIKSKERYRKNLRKSLYQSAKQRSKDGKYLFTITLEDVPEIPLKCPVLNIDMKIGTRYCATIDRIDSSKGYEPGNIQIISRKANSMKSDATREELLLFSKYWIKLFK